MLTHLMTFLASHRRSHRAATVVGRWALLIAAVCGSVVPALAQDTDVEAVLSQSFRANESSDGDQFGGAMAMDPTGTHLVVARNGFAFVFRKVSGNWVFQTKLSPIGEGAGNYGTAVAIRMPWVAVTSIYDEGQPGNGSVHLYRLSTTGGWEVAQRYNPSYSGPGSYYGSSVVIRSAHRDTPQWLVGAPGAAEGGLTGSGAIYREERFAFSFFGNTQYLSRTVQTIRPSDPAAGRHFGATMAFENNNLVVGSRTTDSGLNGAGAYVFAGSGNLTQLQKLTGESIGQVAISGGRVALLKQQERMARIYDFTGDSATAPFSLTGTVATTLTPYVTSIALSGNYLVMGASSHNTSGQPFDQNGGVTLFQRYGNGQWEVRQNFFAPTGQAGGVPIFFGSSLAMRGTELVVGAKGIAGPPGQAYRYTLTPKPRVTFDLDGKGTRLSGGALVQSLNSGGTAAAPVVQANAGWFFKGWDRSFVNVTTNIVVKALYDPIFSVVFDYDGKGDRFGGGETTQVIVRGQSAMAPTVASREGWYFTGWDRPLTNIQEPTTIRALYEPFERLHQGFAQYLDGTLGDWVLDSASDEAGNVYLVGATESSNLKSLPFGAEVAAPGSRSLALGVNRGGLDILVVKYDHHGNLLWARTAGGAGDDAATGISIDLNGQIFISGQISGSATFGAQTVTAQGSSVGVSAAVPNLFVSRISADGIWQDVQPLPLKGQVRSNGNAVAGLSVQGFTLASGRADTGSMGASLGNGLVGVPQSSNQAALGEATFYLKGMLATNSASASAGSSGTLDAWLGLNVSGAEDYRLASLTSAGAHASGTGRWAFVARVTFRAAPAPGQPKWLWEWMRPISTERQASHVSTITDMEVGSDGRLYFTGHWQGAFGAGNLYQSTTDFAPSGFVSSMLDTSDLAYFSRLNGPASLNALALDPQNHALVVGTSFTRGSLTFSPSEAGPDLVIGPPSDLAWSKFLVVARVKPTGQFQWAVASTGSGEADGRSVERKFSGEYYLGGGFRGSPTLAGTSTVALAGEAGASPRASAFLMRVAADGQGLTPHWVRQQRSSLGDLHTPLVRVNALQSVQWHLASGAFPRVVAGVFAINTYPFNQHGTVWGSVRPETGEWLGTLLDWQEYLVGERLERPAGTLVGGELSESLYPADVEGNQFRPLHQALFNHEYYAAAAVEARVLFSTLNDPAQIKQRREGIPVRVRWPVGPEEGLVDYIYGGTIPEVALVPEGSALNFGQVQWRANGATAVNNNQFLRTTADGLASLHFVPQGANITEAEPIIIAVRSTRWDAVVPQQSAVIGATIAPPAEAVPDVREGLRVTGWVMNPRAPYDGAEEVYRRASRLGQIIPVNRERADLGAAGDLQVAWYRRDRWTSLIEWPFQVVDYTPTWPTAATSPARERIVIASEEGSEGRGADGLYQRSFNAATETNLWVYHQPDLDLPGYNPNEEHGLIVQGQRTGAPTAYALRNDLNHLPAGTVTSDPFVLVRFQDLADGGQWKFRVFEVLETDANYPSLSIDSGLAGGAVYPLYPLSLPGFESPLTTGVGLPYFLDKNAQVWAKSAGRITAYYYYQLQPGFWFDVDGDGVQEPLADGTQEASGLNHVPWLAGGHVGEPRALVYDIFWPANVPTMPIGDTVAVAKNGLPGVFNMRSVEVIYDDNDPSTWFPESNPTGSVADKDAVATVRIYDMVTGHRDLLAGATVVEQGTQLLFQHGGTTVVLDARLNLSNEYVFTKLPSDLKERFIYDPTEGEFVFRGQPPITEFVGDPVLLPNIMTDREAAVLMLMDDVNGSESPTETAWDRQVRALQLKSRNPSGIDRVAPAGPDPVLLAGFEPGEGAGTLRHAKVLAGGAMTTAFARGPGYVTLVENNDPSLLGAPVNLHLVRVVDEPLIGQLIALENDNKLDERFVMRHRNEFGGRSDELHFEWWWQPYDIASNAPGKSHPAIVQGNSNGPGAGWTLLAEGTGLNGLTLASGVAVLTDGWALVRYRGLDTAAIDPATWHGFAGDAQGIPTAPFPLFTKGWIKRVLESIDPFEQRYSDFHNNAAQTYVSMLEQAGRPYNGDVALNGDDGDFLNSLGLIELYQTILNRAFSLSLEANPPFTIPAVNDQLLFAATRIADLYLLLGNEAFSDAEDPTIGFTTSAGSGFLEPVWHAFQGLAVAPTLLEEELILLRGRSLTGFPAFPLYNRLPWNFNTDGEPIYNTAYALTDRDGDGEVDEADAMRMFPMGHGDAWGHYLSALKQFYTLARHPEYDWLPRIKGTTIAGTAVEVDYLSERKFAQAALGLARTGLAVTDLEYRLRYTGNPDGQWQGYRDTNPQRAWGVDEWARRTGQATVVNWLVGNALLPEEDTADTDLLAKVDRETVVELATLASSLLALETKTAEFDRGLNPLGIDAEAVPFDLDPALVTAGADTRTHFEQIYDRATAAARGALDLFNFANDQTQRIRQGTLDASTFQLQIDQQEQDLRSRLIEIFGYPYTGDIGPGKTYPTGYNGPDLYHFMYVDRNTVDGVALPPSGYQTIEARFKGFFDSVTEPNPLIPLSSGNRKFKKLFGQDVPGSAAELIDVGPDDTFTVNYPVATVESYSTLAPADWGSRRAPGELQLILLDALRLQGRIAQSQAQHWALVQQVEDQVDLLESRFGVLSDQIGVIDRQLNTVLGLNAATGALRASATILRDTGTGIYRGLNAISEAVPKSLVFGFASGGDVFSPARATIRGAAAGNSMALVIAGGGVNAIAEATAAARDQQSFETRFLVQKAGFPMEVQQHLTQIEGMLREEAALRYQVFQDVLAFEAALARYQGALGRGQRILEERLLLRRQAAGITQQRRYQDMTFRIFRNDALQKYRAAFDLAARYTYLAARAFDYETALLKDDHNAGWRFYDRIVRQRSLGQFGSAGQPVGGSPGLAGPLASMAGTFGTLRGSYGFNNPQIEENAFSLRQEAFRVRSVPGSDHRWRQVLASNLVENVWDVPEFRRLARAPRPESLGPLPALVIPFETAVASGVNYFGWPLGGADSSYDSSRFATRIASAGVWLENYNATGLANTPRVYLIPVGADVLRSPSANDFDVREFVVFDQAIPAPRVLNGEFISNQEWIPANDGLAEPLDTARRFARFRAYHDSGVNAGQMTRDSRLVGRSVWNTRWLLIITGDTLLSDPAVGLSRFIYGDPLNPADRGVTDIKLVFETYSHAGF